LVFMTFFSGPLRAKPEVAHHVHESAWTMTLPLVVLAVLAIVGGVIGWPHLLGGHDWIGEWLTPVVGKVPLPAGDHLSTEILTMSGAFALALGGFIVAFLMYARRIHPAVAVVVAERPWRWLYLRLAGKWHVDELYETTVIKPIEWCSRVVLYQALDKRVIDGGVNLVGWVARSVGFLGQLFQSGNIQRYLAIFAAALAILLYGWLTPSHTMELTDAVEPVAAPIPVPGGVPRAVPLDERQVMPAKPELPPGVEMRARPMQLKAPARGAERREKAPAAAPEKPAGGGR